MSSACRSLKRLRLGYSPVSISARRLSETVLRQCHGGIQREWHSIARYLFPFQSRRREANGRHPAATSEAFTFGKKALSSEIASSILRKSVSEDTR